MRFHLEGEEYRIGDLYFPLANMNLTRTFHIRNTHAISHSLLEKALQSYDFPLGYCYSNNAKVVEVAKDLDLPITFYSGWLFIGEKGFPIHHAWAVWDGNVIDMSIDYRSFPLLEQMDYSNHEWREKFANLLKDQSLLPISDTFIFGKVPENLVYIGSPDTPDNARRTLLRLIDTFPEHPSYQKR